MSKLVRCNIATIKCATCGHKELHKETPSCNNENICYSKCLPKGCITKYTANMQDVFKLKDTDKLKDYCEQLIVDNTETMKAFLSDIEQKSK